METVNNLDRELTLEEEFLLEQQPLYGALVGDYLYDIKNELEPYQVIKSEPDVLILEGVYNGKVVEVTRDNTQFVYQPSLDYDLVRPEKPSTYLWTGRRTDRSSL